MAANEHQTVLVLDFGAQYAQLIARRVREAHVYSEVVPHTITLDELAARKPAAVILSGGPASVYEQDAPQIDAAIFDLGIPVLGICYGFQAMTTALGGTVSHTGSKEYGRTDLELEGSQAFGSLGDDESKLLAGRDPASTVWMSHGDAVTQAPPGFTVTAATPGAPVAAFENLDRKLAGVQFHPEVAHTESGQRIIEAFLWNIAGLDRDWTTANFISDEVAKIQHQIGGDQVICGLSGGVDSAVAAALVQRAVGDQLTCVFVDHGLLREGEHEQVEHDFVQATGANLKIVDAKDRFLQALAGVSDPETKRKIIGREFIRVFEIAAREVVAEAGDGGAGANGEVKYLVQGTLYPDVVESGGGTGAANIKSHHNVGGLPDDLQFELCEPLRDLFKDEVRQVGLQLGLPPEIIWRHPFPGPGLAIRIIGSVDEERLRILRAADAVARQELTAAGLDSEIWQFPVVLLADVRSVGVQGDGRTYGHPVVLRPVASEDAMTADWARLPYDVLAKISTRITNEVPEINRVTLDVTSKPPGTIEWE